jgi:hypothetical protein
MLQVVILSAVISAFFFHDKRPRDRATFTVGSAVALQFSISLMFNLFMENSLTSRGHGVSFDFGEFIVRWLIGAPIVGFIVWIGLWWWYQRNWIDDEADVGTFD